MQPLRGARTDFAEQDDDRLVRRVACVTARDLAEPDARRLAHGDLALFAQLSAPAQQAVAALMKPKSRALGRVEKMIGPTLDYVSIAFLDRARFASRSVVRIVDLDRRPIGTGVMVSPRLVMTNNHVTRDEGEAGDQLVQFDYELGVDDAPKTVTEFRLDPKTLFFTSPQGQLDFTLIALGNRLSGQGDLAGFGFTALSSADDKHAVGDFVTVIEHPNGTFMQIALRENKVIGRGQQGITIHYGADTLPGASGSPVFNDAFEIVALHHASGPLNDTTLEDGSPVPVDSNEGIRISAIARAIRAGADTLAGTRRTLLLGAVDPPFRGPSLLAEGAVPETAESGSSMVVPASPGVPGSGAWPTAMEVGAGWVRVVVPVEIALRESGALAGAGPGSGAGPGLPAGLERNDPPDPDYSNRLGYDRGFLAKPVPLPSLPKALKAQAAQPSGNTAGDLELRFLHFSTVQNGTRRLPFFTAVNIDGALSRGINRTTGEIGELEGLEGGGEKWFADPRVPGSQLVQGFYDDQPHEPHWIFDRGHMVRRLDPAWGSKDTAKRASDDTFHFTNCCPQVWQFNEQAKYWAGIEDYALDNAKLTDERITVFSGPVFAADDPTLLGVAIPKAFWKIVVRVENSALRATGFLASQEQLLADALAAPEAFVGWPDLGRAKVYQKRIAEIAKATGLRFGPLKAADTFVAPPGGGPEALARPIRGLDEVSW